MKLVGLFCSLELVSFIAIDNKIDIFTESKRFFETSHSTQEEKDIHNDSDICGNV